MSKIKSRLLLFVNNKKISKREFCRQIGVSHTYLNDTAEIGSDKLEVILSSFPKLSLEWVLTGEGEMLKKDDMPSEKNEKNEERIDKLIDVLASQQKTILSQQRVAEKNTNKGSGFDHVQQDDDAECADVG